MKRNNKKGFTIVELVVVIAVIGILAAVLIPTFSNIIEKANISADTQLCRNMNTALSTAKADGREFNDMEDVLFTINEAGYIIEHLNPTTEGYYYAWDSENDQIVFLNKKLNVHYPTDANVNPAKCWVTVKSETEANKVANRGFALYLEPKAENGMAIGSLVSIDAGVNTNVDLTLSSTTNGSVTLNGNFNDLDVKAENAHIEFNGVAKTVEAEVSANSFVVNGYVETMTISKGTLKVSSNGIVKTATATGTATVAAPEGLIMSGVNANSESKENFTISNREELAMFRDTVNGGYNYEGKTVKLTADIDLDGIAWLPIGNVYRDNAKVKGITGFAGTFDGQGHTIKNLSNNGFSIDGLASGRNGNSVGSKNEIVFGLFGCAYNATIMNLTVNADIDATNTGFTGDSMAAIVGYVYGTFNMSNCKATGSIKGYDAIGGLVGRSYAVSFTISNCTNEAVVTAGRVVANEGSRDGGIIGYISFAERNGIAKPANFDWNIINCTSNNIKNYCVANTYKQHVNA